MRRVWQVASSSAEYEDVFDEGTIVVDEEVDVAEASNVDEGAVAWSSVDDEGGR
jgi:hypothetical protein